jgi:hypothetical protein
MASYQCPFSDHCVGDDIAPPTKPKTNNDVNKNIKRFFI